MGISLEISDFDEALFQETSEDIVDLAQADAGMFGKLALGADFLPVKGFQDVEVFFGKLHFFHHPPSLKLPSSPRLRRDKMAGQAKTRRTQ